ncbi:MAG: DUF4097 family beta strand repeat protein [Gammaproteobacteria bacterium]|nr:DUF4097 family beta strand repeat protein [Gammaproteobacteria bacterium]
MSAVHRFCHVASLRALAAAASLSIAACSHAAEPTATTVSRSLPLDAGASLRVEVPSGDVEISGDNGAAGLRLSGRLAPGRQLQVDGDARHLRLQVVGSAVGWRGWLHALLHTGSRSGTHLVLQLPAAVALEFHAGSADLRVRGLSGPLSADTASGDVWIESSGTKLVIKTASGDVHVRDPATDETRISTASGDLRLYGIGGRVNLQTASGDIRLEAGTVTELSAGSVSGDLQVRLQPAPEARVKLSTVSGDVGLHLTGGSGATLTLSTVSGDIGTAVPLQFDDRHRRAQGRYGNGSAQVSIKTVSGDIRVGAAPAPAGSVSEMPDAGQRHRHAVLIGRDGHFLVAY